jgi:hypothetical protein
MIRKSLSLTLQVSLPTFYSPFTLWRILILVPDNTKRSCSKLSPNIHTRSSLEISHLRTSLASAPRHISSSDATGTEGVPSESNLIACLSHLAHKQVRPQSINAPDSYRAECRPSATKLQIHRNKVGRLGKESVPDLDVTKCDVGPLLGCVSCEVRWTIKKGTAHKLSHITTCARKKGINPSTLQRLIERELLKLQNAKKNNKTTPRSDSADAVSQTYMESVVADAQTKRKQKRTDTTGTLQPISQTRAAILDRAKALLTAWGAVPCDAPEAEQTQAFGRSKLATGHIQVDVDPIESHLSEECALTSRLALLRSMANPHTACQSRRE